MEQTKLIYKVLSGNASPQEQQTLEEWKGLSAQNQAEYDDIKLLWDAGGNDNEDDPELERGFLELQERMRRWKRKQRINRLLIYVSVMLLILFLVWWLSYHHGTSDKPSVYLGKDAGVVNRYSFQNLVR